MKEGDYLDKKSLRALENVPELAKDCVAFANASGGTLIIGIEDDKDLPPLNQTIPDDKILKCRQRINELTVSVTVSTAKKIALNQGEYFEIRVERSQSPAMTVNGTYLIRDGDNNLPLRPDELARFITDRPSFSWELTLSDFSEDSYNTAKLQDFVERIKSSDRVTLFIKSKSDQEIRDHYLFAREGKLTNLGVLCIGTREQCALLNTAPIVQCIKYDERENKVRKWIWDDYTLAPWELIDAIWNEIPDWQESYEFPEGMFRKNIPVYEKEVVRELLVNALVHRPYNQRGDIFINLFSDHLEIHNPGSFPIGVTPDNILHTSIKRNKDFAKVFYDLKLMEQEGSGYDRIYELLLSSGKRPPLVEETHDRVKISVYKKIIDPYIINFVSRADHALQLTQKERICLGLIAQHKSLTVGKLVKELKLKDAVSLSAWVDRLIALGAVNTSGRTKGKTFSIRPEILRSLDFKGKTTLGAIQPYRLKELIMEDIRTHKKSAISEIHSRIGKEIPMYQLQQTLKQLVITGAIGREGIKKYTRYFHIN